MMSVYKIGNKFVYMKDEKITNELIELAKKGDIDALETVLKDTEKDVYSFLYYLSKDENELSDMVQEILLKVVKNIKNLKDPKHFKGWLNKIITRHYYDCMRKKEKNKKKLKLIDEEPDEKFQDLKQTPIDDCIGSELINAIKSSVLKLPEPYKMAIIMREFKGLTYDEIAHLTDSNVGTVKSRISRARNRLKEYIKPYME